MGLRSDFITAAEHGRMETCFRPVLSLCCRTPPRLIARERYPGGLDHKALLWVPPALCCRQIAASSLTTGPPPASRPARRKSIGVLDRHKIEFFVIERTSPLFGNKEAGTGHDAGAGDLSI